MVTDCLTPIVTPAGVATIVTANGMQALTAGLKFGRVEVESFRSTGINYMFLFTENTHRQKRLYVTPDAWFYTPDGWQSCMEFVDNGDSRKKHLTHQLVRGYWVRCIVCQKLYIPMRPVHGVCGWKCMTVGKKDDCLMFRPLNAETIAESAVEDWLILGRAIPITLDALDSVRVTSMEGEGLYVNGVLTSTKSLLFGG